LCGSSYSWEYSIAEKIQYGSFFSLGGKKEALQIYVYYITSLSSGGGEGQGSIYLQYHRVLRQKERKSMLL